MIDDGMPVGDPKDRQITALRAEVEDLGNRLHHVHRLWANNEHALRAENERLKKRVEWHEHALHTCHDECDKPLCKATRENERLTAEIASLTEEFGIQNNDLGKALLENERLRATLRDMLRLVEDDEDDPAPYLIDVVCDRARAALEEKP